MNCPEVYVPNFNDGDDFHVLQPKAHLTFEFSLTSETLCMSKVHPNVEQ